MSSIFVSLVSLKYNYIKYSIPKFSYRNLSYYNSQKFNDQNLKESTNQNFNGRKNLKGYTNTFSNSQKSTKGTSSQFSNNPYSNFKKIMNEESNQYSSSQKNTRENSYNFSSNPFFSSQKNYNYSKSQSSNNDSNFNRCKEAVEKSSIFKKFMKFTPLRLIMCSISIIFYKLFGDNDFTNEFNDRVFGDSYKRENIIEMLFSGYLTKYVNLFVYEHNPQIVTILASLFRIDLSNCVDRDIREYSSLMDLFTRKPIMNSIDIPSQPVISPCEGKITEIGKIDDLRKLESVIVKGSPYKPLELIGVNDFDSVKSNYNTSLYYCVIYLAPLNIHWFYAPFNVNLENISNIGGFLKILGNLSPRQSKKLHPLNHRVVLQGQSDHGNVFIIPVGSLNVGKIYISPVDKLYDNIQNSKIQSDSEDLFIKKGDELGCFHLGSTIVMIFEGPENMKFLVEPGQSVNIYQPLMTY